MFYISIGKVAGGTAPIYPVDLKIVDVVMPKTGRKKTKTVLPDESSMSEWGSIGLMQTKWGRRPPKVGFAFPDDRFFLATSGTRFVQK